MSYAFTFWTCYVLVNEYEKVASMRLKFLASEKCGPDQFTVICDANKLAKLVKKTESKQNWLDYYQLKCFRNNAKRPFMKTGFFGLWGDKVDETDYNRYEIEKLSKEEAMMKETLELAREPNFNGEGEFNTSAPISEEHIGA